MSNTTPTPSQIEELTSTLRLQHQRLVGLAGAGDDEAIAQLADAVQEIGESLLVADEELRVQNESLAQSARRLDLLVALHEQLFASSTTAFVQTDVDGLIVRYNRAARRLLGLPATTRRSWMLPNLIDAPDRRAVRALITRLRGEARLPLDDPPLEVTTAPASGQPGRPVIVSARRTDEGGPAHQLLHWELAERTAASPDGPSGLPAGSSTAVQVLAAAAVELDREGDVATTLDRVVREARKAVPSCSDVGVTLVLRRGHIQTPAATGELAARCDLLQNRLGDGPCLHAVRTGTITGVPDIAHDERWPAFAAAAAALGVASMLAIPFAARGMSGALNFYATRAGAFDADAELIGRAFAMHAGIALGNTEREETLRAGLERRQEIGCAVGILMERHRLDADTAFNMLVRASQHTQRKLREIAAMVCESGEDPETIQDRFLRSARPTTSTVNEN